MYIKIRNFFYKYIEYISLLILLIVILFIFYKNYKSYVFLSCAAAIGLISYIIFSKYLPDYRLSEPKSDLLNQMSSSLIAVSSIIFFVFYSLSLLTLPYGFYAKTFWYYLFISLCAGSIITDIVFIESKYIWKTNLLKSTLLFLNLSLSNQLVYSLGIGNPDVFYHIYNMVVPIVEKGYIPYGYTYTYFPIHHLLTSMVAIVANISPSITYYYLGSTIMSSGPIFTFLIGRKIFDVKIGLLSALVYCCSDYLIYWSSHPVQLTYTYPMILIFFVALIYDFKDRNAKFTLIYLILCVNIVFLHHYSALITSFMLIMILFLEFFKKVKQKKYNIKSFGLSSIFIILLLAQWMYYSNIFGSLVNIISIYKNAFESDISSNIVSPTYYDSLSLKTLFLNEIGSCILIAFSIIGFFYLLKHRSFFGNIIASLFVLLIGLIVIGVVIKVYFLLPNRIYVFLQELSAVYLASLSVIWIVNSKNNKFVKLGIIFLFIIFQFFSASSTIAGFETSLFTGDQAYWKYYETIHEKSSVHWIEENIVHKGTNHTFFFNPGFYISPDTSSHLSVPFETFPFKVKNGTAIIDVNNINSNSYLIFSDYDVKIGFVNNKEMDEYHMGSGNKIKMNAGVKGRMNDDPFLKCIYNNGMIYIYDNSYKLS